MTTILVVEDNPQHIKLADTLLKRNGHTARYPFISAKALVGGDRGAESVGGCTQANAAPNRRK